MNRMRTSSLCVAIAAIGISVLCVLPGASRNVVALRLSDAVQRGRLQGLADSLVACGTSAMGEEVSWDYARLCLLTGEWSAAHAFLERYLAGEGSQAPALLGASLLAAKRGAWQEAQGWLERVDHACGESAKTRLAALDEAYAAGVGADWDAVVRELETMRPYMRARPLFSDLYDTICDETVLRILTSADAQTPESLLDLATQHWRVGDFAEGERVALLALEASAQLSPRQRSWAWYLVAEGAAARGDVNGALEGYQEGLAADSSLVSNVWGALDVLADSSLEALSVEMAYYLALQQIEPEGRLCAGASSSSLCGYTVVPKDTVAAADGPYDVFLFWSLGSLEAERSDVRRTDRWAVQRLRARDLATNGSFAFADRHRERISGWEGFVFPGVAQIETAAGASRGALRLEITDGHAVMLRGIPPLGGVPVEPLTPYLVTARARVEADGVVTIRCIWTLSSGAAVEEDGQGSRAYIETYAARWQDLGVLLIAPRYARTCELRVGYHYGSTAGWVDSIRLFALTGVER